MKKRIIVHIDMDAFFAAIEQRDRPQLKGKLVVIGADPKGGRGRGVVSTCSYEARRYGIHSAQPISHAYRLCPHAVFLPVDFRKYRKVSSQIRNILDQFTPDVEPISIDEAFLDITGCDHFYGSAIKMCQELKKKIKEEVHLTASVGIAPVKFVAKIASDLCKPDGLLEVKEDGVISFLRPLPIERLWGVGPKTKASLNGMGIRTVGDLAGFSSEDLVKQFGTHGQHLYFLAHGIDERDVSDDDEVKSVSHEHTFEEDVSDIDQIYNELLVLSEKISRRLRKLHLKGSTLTVKIRLKGFKTYSRAFTFPKRIHFVDDIYKKSKELFDTFHTPNTSIRLIGIRITNFAAPYVQDNLFVEKSDIKSEQVHRAVDLIKDKFGEEAIHRGL